MKRRTQARYADAMRELFEKWYKAENWRDWKQMAQLSIEAWRKATRQSLRRLPEPSPKKLQQSLEELPLAFAKTRRKLYKALGAVVLTRGGRPSLLSAAKKKEALMKVVAKGGKLKLAMQEVADEYKVGMRTIERLWADRDVILGEQTARKGKHQ